MAMALAWVSKLAECLLADSLEELDEAVAEEEDD
jgi:hypothetical protein